MVLLCLALAKDESKLVISGCPVLLPCELVTDGVEAIIGDNGLVSARSEEAGEEREALPGSGVLVLLCLALASAESMLVIGGCPVLLTCEPVADVLDDHVWVFVRSEKAGDDREAFPASGVWVLLCLALASVESMLVVNECSAL